MSIESKIKNKIEALRHDNTTTRSIVNGIISVYANGEYSLDHASRLIRPQLTAMRSRADQVKALSEVLK